MTYTKAQEKILDLLPLRVKDELEPELMHNIYYYGNRYATSELKKAVKQMFPYIYAGNAGNNKIRILREHTAAVWLVYGFRSCLCVNLDQAKRTLKSLLEADEQPTTTLELYTL